MGYTLKPDEFLLSEDPDRMVKVIGSFTPENKIHAKVVQEVPDRFFDTVQYLAEAQAGAKRGTQNHVRHLAEIPDTLYHELMTDSTGKLIHDPDERTKRVKRLVSDIEYRKLHVGKA